MYFIKEAIEQSGCGRGGNYGFDIVIPNGYFGYYYYAFLVGIWFVLQEV